MEGKARGTVYQCFARTAERCADRPFLNVLEETIASLTPDFLDLKLRRQEALASAEIDELDSLINYNTAIADLHRSTGTALDRNQIRFVVPDAGDYLSESP